MKASLRGWGLGARLDVLERTSQIGHTKVDPKVGDEDVFHWELLDSPASRRAPETTVLGCDGGK